MGDLDEKLDKKEELINFRINIGAIKDRETMLKNMDSVSGMTGKVT
jgi:hypothetical protein